jgi:multidrug efflux system membrane fusion protein
MDEDQPRRFAHYRRRPVIFAIGLIILVAIILAFLHSCARSKIQTQKPPTPVAVAKTKTSDVPVYLNALGSVIPVSTVTVRTQISGTLLKVYYKEGQMVKMNDPLAEIDPRPYLAQLEQFQGQLARDTAQLENARIDLQRYQKLYPQGAVSQQLYYTQSALVRQLEGVIKLDQGEIDQVKVNLVYCHIISPINGRVGLRLVDAGNYVQIADNTPLVVVNDIQPITVVFALPEDSIPDVSDAIDRGKPVLTKAYDRTQNRLLDTGTLLTIDNQINSATGTVNLRAQFPNKKLKLFPNQFVNVKLLVNRLLKATIVPTSAIQSGPQGTFVYILNKNKTVSLKKVKTGVTYGENTVINNGVSAGEWVVTEGADQLVNGAKVVLSNKGHQ